MTDFQSERFRRSLAETVAWCALQSVAPSAPTLTRNRHALYEQSEQQMQQASASAARGWPHRKITETKQWHQSMALLKEVRDSLGPLEGRLRSPVLAPSFALDDFGANAPWAEAVAEVTDKRSRLLSKTSPHEGAGSSISGRLLLYWPHENLADALRNTAPMDSST